MGKRKAPWCRCPASFCRVRIADASTRQDGQLYVTSMGAGAHYGVDDGCFHRVRYTGERVQLPGAFHVHQNGILVSFMEPVDRAIATQPRNHFAQAWNYRYSAGYGSPEFSPRHFGI